MNHPGNQLAIQQLPYDPNNPNAEYLIERGRMAAPNGGQIVQSGQQQVLYGRVVDSYQTTDQQVSVLLDAAGAAALSPVSRWLGTPGRLIAIADQLGAVAGQAVARAQALVDADRRRQQEDRDRAFLEAERRITIMERMKVLSASSAPPQPSAGPSAEDMAVSAAQRGDFSSPASALGGCAYFNVLVQGGSIADAAAAARQAVAMMPASPSAELVAKWQENAAKYYEVASFVGRRS